jgi:hypothetical protein
VTPEERRLLRWYPAAWVDRYGPEMLAMVEDGSGGGRVPTAVRFDLMRSGVKERLRRRGFIGHDRPLADQARAGATLVLCGWAALVVAGAMFAKSTEHWSDQIRPGQRGVADAAFAVVYGAAAAGGAAVAVAVLALLPALYRALRGGRWRPMSRPVDLAVALTAGLMGATVGLAAWARHLTNLQRNGGSAPYTGAFLLWGAFFVVVVMAWTRAGIRVEGQLEPGRKARRAEFLAAAVTAGAIFAVVAAMVAWWVAAAMDTPWILHGAPEGTASGGFVWNLAIASLVGLGAAALAAAGTERLISARGAWRT